MVCDSKAPRVSIGMPVFNAEKYLQNSLDALLSQTYSNFELIISDNASLDKTKEICEQYAKNDKRIKYILQTENIGVTKNFQFVFDQAVGQYFMWAAADDIRSSCFIEKNINFLDLHLEYVASTSKNYFEGDELEPEKHITFAIEGDLNERLKAFIRNCLSSHGIFYSLIRIEYLRNCEAIGKRIIAADWIIDVHLLSSGPIKRIDEGYMISGRSGVSNSVSPYKLFQNHFIEYIFPLYLFSKYFLTLIMKSDQLSITEKKILLFMLIRVNLILSFSKFLVMLKNVPGYKFLREKIQ